MRDPTITANRPLPERIDRTTRAGADQYVLACNARRDADDLTFANLERLERENHQLRAEVQWKLEHASTRTSRWVWSRVMIVAWLLVGLAGIGMWTYTPNGRAFRSGLAEGHHAATARPAP